MIDYASIAPMVGLSTFIAGFIIVLLIGRAIAELAELIEKKKSPRDWFQQSGRPAKVNTFAKNYSTLL